ncbi:hypothetical protein BDR06DRAFT_950355, partial [Suillus hirtellus]
MDDLFTIAGASSQPRDGTMIDLTARIKEHLTGNPDRQSAKVRRTSWGQTNECHLGNFNFRPTAEFATITSCNLRFLTARACATPTFHASVVSHWFPYSRVTSASNPTFCICTISSDGNHVRILGIAIYWHEGPERRQPTVAGLLTYKETLL